MYSLLIDTCTDKAILVLYKDGLVLEIMEEESRHHSNHIVSMIAKITRNNKIVVNDLKEIICVNGPGSFTGVRIGVTIAKSLAYTINIPIKTISSLMVKAINSDNKNVCLSDINGKYIGLFDNDNNFKEDMFYLNNDDLNKIKYSLAEEVDIDYNKVYKKIKDLKPIICHSVKALYIKKIEVEND